MKILILTQFFPPEMGAPQARLYELAVRLIERGHTVTVLTAVPNYPTGRVFGGYRWKLWTTESIDGIRVVRTCLMPSKSRSILIRTLSSLSFVLCSVLFGGWACLKQDVLVFNSPPLFTALAAIPLKWISRAKTLMYVADIWPESFIQMGKSPTSLPVRLLSVLERLAYRISDVVALVTPGAQKSIEQRFPKANTTLFSNGADTNVFRAELRSMEVRQRYGVQDDVFLVGYIGLHGVFQGLGVLVKAAERLKDNPKIQFLSIGDGVEKKKLIELAKEKGLENIQFCDPIAKKDVPAILASCDCSVVPLAVAMPSTMPSKIYEALASGVPAMLTQQCQGQQLVEENNLGRTFAPMDDAQLASAISELAGNADEVAQVRENCLRVAPRFSRDSLADNVNAVLIAMHEGTPLPDVTW